MDGIYKIPMLLVGPKDSLENRYLPSFWLNSILRVTHAPGSLF
jgi:hypothetical protein